MRLDHLLSRVREHSLSRDVALKNCPYGETWALDAKKEVSYHSSVVEAKCGLVAQLVRALC